MYALTVMISAIKAIQGQSVRIVRKEMSRRKNNITVSIDAKAIAEARDVLGIDIVKELGETIAHLADKIASNETELEAEKMGNLFHQMFEGMMFGEFKPCFAYNEAMDWLEYIEEDCCTVTEYQKGSNIALLRKWDGEKYCGVVGIKIEGFSAVATPELVEAFKAYNTRDRKNDG